MVETGNRARIVLCGMRCAFTAAALEALLAAPVDLRAIVLPGPEPGSGEPMREATARGIPVLTAANRDALGSAALIGPLAALAPELVVVACFPWRLPRRLRAVPRHGCLNLHPSLLPAGRGPEPVFWTFRRDERESGVTIHRLDAGFDTGPILAQCPVEIPSGATVTSLEREVARRGVELLAAHLPRLRDGSATYTPQAGEPPWLAPHPGRDDLAVPTGWPAARAARFIGAVAETWGPLPVLVEATGQRLAVREVVDRAAVTSTDAPVRIAGELARIRFDGGALTCRLAMPVAPLSLHRKTLP